MIAKTLRRTKTFQRIRWKVFAKREVFAITGNSHVPAYLAYTGICVFMAAGLAGSHWPGAWSALNDARRTGVRDGRTANEVRLPARWRSS
jgi:hypothetical protein